MKLRYYQDEAVASVYNHLYKNSTNPCVVIPTGGGKSLTMATICRDAVTKWNGRVLVLAHVKELLEQTAGTLRKLAPDVPVGVYSAGLGSRNTGEPVIVAGIQSVYQKAAVLGRFNLIIVDEAHLLPEDGEGMYRTFLSSMREINPNVRLIGFTATPYRMKSGMICGPDNLLNEICYEVGIKELIARGFLCPLKSKGSEHAVDTSGLHMRGGEFVSDEVESLVGADEFEQAACREIVTRTKNHNSVLVFAATVARAESVKNLLAKYSGEQCAVVTGETSANERDLLLRRFKGQRAVGSQMELPLLRENPLPLGAGINELNNVERIIGGEAYCNETASFPPLKYLVNVNVLTTGFDAPNIDCIVLLRPTASPGLYYQMVGRGFRLHESKTHTLVLDYGNNITRHGPVDSVRIKERSEQGGGEAPAKECPKCHQIVHAAISVCNECGYEFPKREVNHEKTASNEGVVSGETIDTTYSVLGIDYAVHRKHGAGEFDPQSVRVDYLVQHNRNYSHSKSEWVCPEHSGWARKKFEDWWKKRSNTPPPNTADEVVEIAESDGLTPALEITVRKVAGEKYDRIIKHRLADGPQPDFGGTADRAAALSRTCGDCNHHVYGFCNVKQRYGFTGQTVACGEFSEADLDEVPF